MNLPSTTLSVSVGELEVLGSGLLLSSSIEATFRFDLTSNEEALRLEVAVLEEAALSGWEVQHSDDPGTIRIQANLTKLVRNIALERPLEIGTFQNRRVAARFVLQPYFGFPLAYALTYNIFFLPDAKDD